MFKSDATEGDGGFAVSVVRVKAEDFGFRLIDGEKEELSGAFESGDEALETFSVMAGDGHVVRIEEDLQKEVDLTAADGGDTKLSVDSVTEGHTIRRVGKGNTNDVVKEDGEESRGEDTTLTNAVVSEKGGGKAAVGTNGGVGVGVEILEKAEDFGGDTGALTDKPERTAIHFIVGLEKVYETGMDGDVEFEGTAENLAEDEDLVCGTAGFAESRLVLKNGSLHALGDTGVEDVGIHFARDREKTDSPMAVALKAGTFVLIDRNNDGVLPVLGRAFGGPNAGDDVVKPR